MTGRETRGVYHLRVVASGTLLGPGHPSQMVRRLDYHPAHGIPELPADPHHGLPRAPEAGKGATGLRPARHERAVDGVRVPPWHPHVHPAAVQLLRP